MDERTPFQSIIRTTLGFGLSRCLHVAAELGVADHIHDGPASSDELARAVNANPESLGRLMRVLCDHGIFQLDGGRFSHTPMSHLLKSDHPRSLRSYVRMVGLPWFWGAYQHLEKAVRTGKPALEVVVPEGIFRHFEAHPEEGRLFDEAMTRKAQADIASVLSSYDFSRFQSIADIGGGRGHLLSQILNTTPRVRGVLFDLPRVIETVQDLASERLELRPGDFFVDPLPACDAYFMMEVIHDWSDADSVRILSAVRRAAGPGAKLLVIELLIPEAIGPNSGALLDLAMMTLLGGKQRTLQEYGQLYAAAGFRLDRVITTSSEASIIEGTAV
jgi:hypothetical protein